MPQYEFAKQLGEFYDFKFFLNTRVIDGMVVFYVIIET